MNLNLRNSKFRLDEGEVSGSPDAREALEDLNSLDVEQTFQLILAVSGDEVVLEQELCLLLGMAAAQGNLDLVDILLRFGTDLNPTDPQLVEPLWYATANQHVDVAERLLKAGAKIEHSNGRNVLLPAIVSGNADLVLLLLKFGANPDAKFAGWPKPASLALTLGHLDIVRMLSDASTTGTKKKNAFQQSEG